jgi:hypothetical protein
MMELPRPDKFDPEKESTRFGWLLYGTEEEMYEIHGGCGFCKKLLHVVSQITYCTARLQQDVESPMMPVTIRFLQTELMQMRQWSSETNDWEMAKANPPIIDLVRQQPPDYKIESPTFMTDVTAEAWRIAALLYLQCRALRYVAIFLIRCTYSDGG